MVEVTKVFDILVDLVWQVGSLNITISDRWNTFDGFKLIREFFKIDLKLTRSGGAG